jgi:hypothetical protein
VLEIAGDAELVGIEQQEIRRIHAGLFGRGGAALFAARRLDLDHFRPQPGERLRSGRAGFELGEIDHSYAGKCGSCGSFMRHCSTPVSDIVAYSATPAKLLGGKPGCAR